MNGSIRVLSGALLLVASLCASRPSFATPRIDQQVLPNGLTLIVAESHAVPLVTLEYTARTGAIDETPEYNGLSHLYEHMFFKANAAIPNQEAFMRRTRELGMAFNGSTGVARVNYFFTTTSDHFPEAMAFMKDAVRTPLFDPVELEKERVVVTGEIDRAESNPYFHFNKALNRRAFATYPTRKQPLGERSTVLSATPAMMRTIEQRFYVPNNSALIVTGDVRATEVFASAARLYGDWPRGEEPAKAFPIPRHPPLARSETFVLEQPVETVTGAFLWHGPSSDDASVSFSYGADVLAMALAEPSSRFQKDLVDSGACISASLAWETERNVGPVTLFFEATPDKADACVRAIAAELPRLAAADYLSDEERANAAHRIAVSRVLEREKPSQLSQTLSFWWCQTGLPYYLTYPDEVAKVTAAQTAEFAQAYVIGRPFVLGVMASKATIAERHLDERHLAELAGVQR